MIHNGREGPGAVINQEGAGKKKKRSSLRSGTGAFGGGGLKFAKVIQEKMTLKDT